MFFLTWILDAVLRCFLRDFSAFGKILGSPWDTLWLPKVCHLGTLWLHLGPLGHPLAPFWCPSGYPRNQSSRTAPNLHHLDHFGYHLERLGVPWAHFGDHLDNLGYHLACLGVPWVGLGSLCWPLLACLGRPLLDPGPGWVTLGKWPKSIHP